MKRRFSCKNESPVQGESSLNLYLPRKKSSINETLIFFQIQQMIKKYRDWSCIDLDGKEQGKNVRSWFILWPSIILGQTYGGRVSWDCRIHRLNLSKEVRLPPTSILRGMESTLSLPTLPGSLWLGVIVPDRVLSMGQIDLNNVLMLD